jgi:hypothetical protein
MGVDIRTKVIRDIESCRTMLSDRIEITLALPKFTGIHEASLREKHKLVEKRNDVTTWLMNREDHSAVEVARECDETLNNIEGIVRVQACRGVVKKGTLESITRNVPLVGSSRNRIDGLVTSSHAIDTRRFSPPEIERWPRRAQSTRDKDRTHAHRSLRSWNP